MRNCPYPATSRNVLGPLRASFNIHTQCFFIVFLLCHEKQCICLIYTKKNNYFGLEIRKWIGFIFPSHLETNSKLQHIQVRRNSKLFYISYITTWKLKISQIRRLITKLLKQLREMLYTVKQPSENSPISKPFQMSFGLSNMKRFKTNLDLSEVENVVT